MSCQGETGRGAFWVALCSAEARASAGICLLLFRRQLGGGLGLAYGNHVYVRPSKDYKYMQARRSSRTTASFSWKRVSHGASGLKRTMGTLCISEPASFRARRFTRRTIDAFHDQAPGAAIYY